MPKVDPRSRRRLPSAERAEDTVDAIIEATARVVASVGPAKLTTTRVAAIAGVSIGTLYHYFPTKAALLAAWEERSLRTLMSELQAQLVAIVQERQGSAEATALAIARRCVEGVITFARAQNVGSGEPAPIATRAAKEKLLEECTQFLLIAFASFPTMIRPKNQTLAATFVVRAVINLGLVGVAEEPEAVASGAFQDELATMIVRYLFTDESLAILASG